MLNSEIGPRQSPKFGRNLELSPVSLTGEVVFEQVSPFRLLCPTVERATSSEDPEYVENTIKIGELLLSAY